MFGFLLMKSVERERYSHVYNYVSLASLQAIRSVTGYFEVWKSIMDRWIYRWIYSSLKLIMENKTKVGSLVL